MRSMVVVFVAECLNSSFAWSVNFSYGNVSYGYKGYDGYVRLVRAGQ